MVFQCLELRIQSLVVSKLTTHVPASTAKKVGVCYVCARVQIDVSKNDSKNVLQTDSKHGKPGRTVSGHGDLEETALREIGFERSAGVQPTFGTGSTSSERSLPCLPPVKGIDTETGGEEKVHQKQLVNFNS